MFIQGLTCGDEFFVTHPTLQEVPLILGRAWQQRYNCSINWANQIVSCTINEVQTSVKLQQPMTLNLIHKEEVSTTNANNMVKKAASINEESALSKPITPSQPVLSTKDHHQMTIPSSSTSIGANQIQEAKGINKQVVHHNQLMWIPKTLLTGVTANGKVWITKLVKPMKNNPPTNKPKHQPQEVDHK